MYGLSQHYLNKIRNAFKRGELSFDDAMYNLAVHYSNNIVFDIKMQTLDQIYKCHMENWNNVFNNSKL